VEQSTSSLTIIAASQDGGPAAVSVYPLDGRSERYQTGKLLKNTATKWEGDALLVNTIVNDTAVSGPEGYSVAERWMRSIDGNSLSITRNVVRAGSETESVLIYTNTLAINTLAAPPPPAPLQTEHTSQPPALIPRPTPPVPDPAPYVVAAGTHILLRLTNAVNTKHTAVGDHVYLETAVPVFVNGRLIIPQGSYVTGTVTESTRAGRVKGKSGLTLSYDSITLRNGTARDLRSHPDSVDAKGTVDKSEGRIQGDGNVAGDTGTVAKTTAAGTGVGAIAGGAAGHLGMGMGIGAGAGALAGLGSVFGSRGPDVVLPQGTTMDMIVDRDLRYSDEDLRTHAQ
jgi:type IV secretion system protein VirB10